MSSQKILGTHLKWPTLLFLLAAGMLAFFDADPAISASWAYKASTGWLAAGPTWETRWLHDGGKDLIIIIACMAGAGWALGTAVPSLSISRWAGELGMVALSMGCTALLIGGLKQITNVDCPSDLLGFGGARPYLGVFRPRPVQMPHAVCFPGAHAGAGFSLFAFYFAFRDRVATAARWLLVVAVATGTTFAFAQEARGAHFLSHDLWSAYLAWVVSLTVYVARTQRAASTVRGSEGRTAEPIRQDRVGDVGV